MIIPPGIGGNLKCEKINYTQYSSTDKWGGGLVRLSQCSHYEHTWVV